MPNGFAKLIKLSVNKKKKSGDRGSELDLSVPGAEWYGRALRVN